MYACHCFVGYLEWVGVGEVRARTSCEEVQESGVEVSIYPTSLRCHDEERIHTGWGVYDGYG